MLATILAQPSSIRHPSGPQFAQPVVRELAGGDRTVVRSESLDELVTELRLAGGDVTSTDRSSVTVRGLDPAGIGLIARDAGIALTSLVPEERTLEDVFMSLTADTVEYHGAERADLIGATR